MVTEEDIKEMTKDSIRFAIFIGFGAFIIIMTLYLILHKQIEEVEEKITPLQEQMLAITEGQTKEADNKTIIQECHSKALEDAKKFFDFKEKALLQTDKPDTELLKTKPVFDINQTNDGIWSDNSGILEDDIYYPDYEQYYTLCMREKGYVE